MSPSTPSDAFDLSTHFAPVSPDAWREAVERESKGASFEKKFVRASVDGVRTEPLYTSEDIAPGNAVGLPGASPWIRGHGKAGAWETRQRCTIPSVQQANAAILEQLECGVDSVELELTVFPGRRGIVVQNLDALDRLLDGVKLGHAPIGIRTGSDFLTLAAAFFALVERRGTHAEHVHADLNCDPIGSLARYGALPVSLDRAFDEAAELSAIAHAQYPCTRVLTADATTWHDAGGGDAQSLGFAVASTVEMLRVLEKRGLSLVDGAAQVVFRLPVSPTFFRSIALIRATRLVWTLVQEHCGIEHPQPAIIHTVPATRWQTRRDPWVNMLRNTSACFAGAVGGADIITTSAFDVLLGVPSNTGRRVARNTQNILRHESNLHRVSDPAGGAWFIESLTQQLAEGAWSALQDIEAMGGMAKALLSGAVHTRLAAEADARLQQVARRKIPVTGVSEFPAIRQPQPPTSEVEDVPPVPAAEAISLPRDVALAFLVERIADGARIDALAESFPEPSVSIAPLPMIRNGSRFEDMQERGDVAEAEGHRPTVFLACLGSLADYKPRATFATNLLHAGGLDVADAGSLSANSVGEAYTASGAQTVIICGTDAEYGASGAEIARALSEAGATHIGLAGRPRASEEALRHAGVAFFIYMGCDTLQALDGIWAVSLGEES